MGKEITTFGNTEIEIQKFHHYKNSISEKDMEIDNLLISNKTTSSGEKFINIFLVTWMMIQKLSHYT